MLMGHQWLLVMVNEEKVPELKLARKFLPPAKQLLCIQLAQRSSPNPMKAKYLRYPY